MTITAKFAGTCCVCKRAIPTGTPIDWTRGVGARHLTAADCEAAAEKAAPVAPSLNMAPVVAFLTAARDRGLKFPKVAFLGPEGAELRLSLAAKDGRNPGAVYVKLDGLYIGLVAADGTVRGGGDDPSTRLNTNTPVLTLLTTIALDPATAAANYGAVMGRCSFCNLALSDEGSVEVGYGPICAKRYGLPHAPKGTPALTLSPVELWDRKVATVAQTDGLHLHKTN